MNRKISIETDCCLLIFDFHQNLEWVEGILAKEDGRFTHLLLGGDYFDQHPGRAGAADGEVCDYLRALADRFGERLTVLLGNHDIHYLEAIRRSQAGRPLQSRYYRCSGYSDERAAVIAESLGDDFWRGCRLFQFVNGHMVSHAGVAARFWNSEVALEKALEALEGECAGALEKVAEEKVPLLDAGFVRGGNEPVGGITWLDFDREFTDAEIGPPQICGHTASARGGPRERARTKGRSWCLDGHQTCYGRLHKGGRLEIGVVAED
jgi:hypothetical protein